jgi:hypothetical protein
MRSGTRPLSGMGETRNMSSGGVLFATGTKIDLGDPIEYEITLSGDGNGAALVRLHCLGKVVRTQERQAEAPEDPGFEVAVTLERYEFVRRNI